jgi:hypothetical protein
VRVSLPVRLPALRSNSPAPIAAVPPSGTPRLPAAPPAPSTTAGPAPTSSLVASPAPFSAPFVPDPSVPVPSAAIFAETAVSAPPVARGCGSSLGGDPPLNQLAPTARLVSKLKSRLAPALPFEAEFGLGAVVPALAFPTDSSFPFSATFSPGSGPPGSRSPESRSPSSNWPESVLPGFNWTGAAATPRSMRLRSRLPAWAPLLSERLSLPSPAARSVPFSPSSSIAPFFPAVPFFPVSPLFPISFPALLSPPGPPPGVAPAGPICARSKAANRPVAPGESAPAVTFAAGPPPGNPINPLPANPLPAATACTAHPSVPERCSPKSASPLPP